jgi:epsilon-lactone hydrolase
MTDTQPTLANAIYHKEHLLDRAAMLAMRAMLALQPAADLGPGGRAAFDELMAKTPSAEGVTYEAAVVGGVSGWWCRPAHTDLDTAILYFHGGAYVLGSAQAYRHFAGQIATRAEAAVFVANYGLAPERPFPAAVDDADAAYRGLALAGFSSIAVAGDSAGGGLALITAARMARAARDGSVPRPAAVCVMSPWIDLALTSDSIGARAKHDPLLTRDALEDARRLYLGQANAKDPRASPLYGDLTDLPPVLLHVGADEILLDDARRYAHLLANSGPAAELHVWEGMVHVFPANLVLLQAAREALDLAGEFLRRKRSLAE